MSDASAEELNTLRAALLAWELWCAENEKHLESLAVIGHIHGVRYAGTPWPREQGQAALMRHVRRSPSDDGGPR